MVKVSNQRKGVPRYAGVVGGLIARTSENQKSWLWRHCRRRAIPDYSDHPRKLVTLNPKLKSAGAGRCNYARWWDAYAASNGLKELLESQDAVALQQIKERGALPMIDRDINQGNRPLPRQYLGFTAGRDWSVRA